MENTIRLNNREILNCKVTISPKAQILEYMEKCLKNYIQKSQKYSKSLSKSIFISTPNTEQIVYAQKNQKFQNILNQADVAIPDSVGVLWAMQLLNEIKLENRISGSDFLENIVQIAEKYSVPIALIGGRSGVALSSFECLKVKYPQILGWADDGVEIELTNQRLTIKNDDIEKYCQSLINRIRETKVGVVFVGFGAPKQEYLIDILIRTIANAKFHHRVFFMSVGGTFDILSGHLVRAPKVLQKIGLEWLWRLIIEPKRFVRQLALVKFVILVVFRKIN